MLGLSNTWFEDGHKFVRWTPATSTLLRHAKIALHDDLAPDLARQAHQLAIAWGLPFPVYVVSLPSFIFGSLKYTLNQFDGVNHFLDMAILY